MKHYNYADGTSKLKHDVMEIFNRFDGPKLDLPLKWWAKCDNELYKENLKRQSKNGLIRR